MTGARRYGPRKPVQEVEHKGGRDRPDFIKAMTDDEVREFLLDHTIHSAAQVVGVSEATIKNYELEFGVRCRRRCVGCGKVFPYDEMYRETNGAARSCPPCKEAAKVRATTPDRELMAMELRDPFANYARMSLTRKRPDGINGWRWGHAMRWGQV